MYARQISSWRVPISITDTKSSLSVLTFRQTYRYSTYPKMGQNSLRSINSSEKFNRSISLYDPKKSKSKRFQAFGFQEITTIPIGISMQRQSSTSYEDRKKSGGLFLKMDENENRLQKKAVKSNMISMFGKEFHRSLF